MNKFLALSVGILLASSVRTAHARAAYQSPKVMIANSEAIAIVQIDSVETAPTKGPNWTYGQKATARVERTLKGQLPTTLTVLGDENFSCARCHFETGRFLVFLKREKEGWAGVNYESSSHKIEDEKVNWDNVSPLGDRTVALDTALANITTIIRVQKHAPHYSLSTGTQDKARLWGFTEEGNPENSRTLKQPEFDEWLRTLTPGTKLTLANSCLGNNATSEEVGNLRSFAYAHGLEFVLIPAG